MVDEMFLCKCTQYSGGDFTGYDTKENLYKGVILFMIQGIKNHFHLLSKHVQKHHSMETGWLKKC